MSARIETDPAAVLAAMAVAKERYQGVGDADPYWELGENRDVAIGPPVPGGDPNGHLISQATLRELVTTGQVLLVPGARFSWILVP